MSMDILQPFIPPPLKRSRETISFVSDGASKCGEIFVTNNAEQWTFHCAYCPKAAMDIGVFICHIRLEHLKAQTDLTLSKQTLEEPGNMSPKIIGYSPENCSNLNRMPGLSTNTQQQPPPSDIAKEEVTIACSQENLQTSCGKIADITDITLIKNSIPKSQQDNEVIFTITPIDSQETQQQLISKQVYKDITQVVYVKNEAENEYGSNNSTNEINKEANNEKLAVNDSDSCYSPNEDDGDDTDFEINEVNEASGSSENKIMKMSIAASENNSLSTFKCPYCVTAFNSKSSLGRHIFHFHDKKLPIRCEKCQRGFLTSSGLKVHLKYHKENCCIQCPVCKTKHMEHYFITHILTHESATCFPCQVCGKLYASQEERMTHWKTHTQEKPFACNICYRRYGKHSYLTRHLRRHNQYLCNFCQAKFNATEAQRPPYACAKCEKLPDIKRIKQKAEHLRSVALINHVFDSDEDTLAAYNPSDEVAAQHNQKSIDNKQILLFSNANNETRDEPYNDSTAHSLNKEMDSDGDDDKLSNGNGSDLEFLDETYDVDNKNDDDGVPSGIGYKTIQLEEDSTHKCSYCDRVFKSRKSLGSHIKCHSNNENVGIRFKCSYCNKGFLTKSGLTFHHKTHDKTESKFKCPICQFSCYLEGRFINHVLTHEGESCFPCQVCAKILHNNEERLAHWKTHKHEKPHGCKFCYRRFTLKRILHCHLQTHIEYKE